jgi:hypothetical protein
MVLSETWQVQLAFISDLTLYIWWSEVVTNPQTLYSKNEMIQYPQTAPKPLEVKCKLI